MNRRQLLQGAGALLVAPALVRASSIMPVKALCEHGPVRRGDYWVPYFNGSGEYSWLRVDPVLKPIWSQHD